MIWTVPGEYSTRQASAGPELSPGWAQGGGPALTFGLEPSASTFVGGIREGATFQHLVEPRSFPGGGGAVTLRGPGFGHLPLHGSHSSLAREGGREAASPGCCQAQLGFLLLWSACRPLAPQPETPSWCRDQAEIAGLWGAGCLLGDSGLVQGRQQGALSVLGKLPCTPAHPRPDPQAWEKEGRQARLGLGCEMRQTPGLRAGQLSQAQAVLGCRLQPCHLCSCAVLFPISDFLWPRPSAWDALPPWFLFPCGFLHILLCVAQLFCGSVFCLSGSVKTALL